jgi:hypothetical protein
MPNQDNEDHGVLHGIVMGNDYAETIDELLKSAGAPNHSYVFVERIEEPA